MSPRTVVFGAFLFLLPLAARAQTESPGLAETVDVTVASIEVVVTDAKGNRVRGLTIDDFQLLENGARQPITNFSEIDDSADAAAATPAAVGEGTAAPPPAATVGEPPPRRVVVFVDLLTTDTFQRKRLSSSISSILDTLGPRDEIMLVSWNGSLVIEVAPTSDPQAVRAGLAQLAKRSSISRAAKLQLEQGTSATWRRQTVQMLTNDLKRSVVALRILLGQMTPVGGRKVLVLISEGFQLQPGRELFKGPHPFDLDVQAILDMEGEQGPDLIKSLAEAANAAGVTLYTIHGGGLSALSSVEHASVMPELDLPRPDLPNEPPRNLELPPTSDEAEMVRERIANSVEGLTELAERSGGTITKNLNDFRTAFRAIAADLARYYSLGYRVAPDAAATERRVEIVMRDPRLTARARTSIVIRTAEMEIADAVIGRLAFPGGANDLGISAQAADAERSGRRRLSIPIDVLIPLEPLSFVEEKDAFTANVSIYLGATDAGNATTEVRRFDHPLRIAKADFPSIGGTHYTYRMTLDLRSRSVENRVAIGVMDITSKLTGFAVIDIGEDDVAERPR